MYPSSLTDMELIDGAKDGNFSDWEELVDRYYPKLKAYLSAQMHDSDAGAEVSHEAFISAQLLLGKYPTGRPFAGWLFRIAQYHMLRRRRYEVAHSTLGLEDVPTAAIPILLKTSDIADNITAADSVKAVLLDLSPKLRNALVLHVIAGFQAPDVALKLKISTPAAEKRISRAKEQFRSRYAELNNEPRHPC